MAGVGKKRYQLTLTTSTVDRFQKIAEELKMPQGIMSLIVDQSLEQVTATMEKLQKKGTATFADLFQLIGESLDEMQKEVVQDDAKAVEGGKEKKAARKKA